MRARPGQTGHGFLAIERQGDSRSEARAVLAPAKVDAAESCGDASAGKSFHAHLELVGLGDQLRVVGADQGDAVLGAASGQLDLVRGHVGHAAQALQVRLAHVDHHRDVRAKHGRQVVHLQLLADARLQNPEVVVLGRPQETQRRAQPVVEILVALGGLAHPTEDGGAHVLDRGLARGPGDRDNLGVCRAPVRRGQLAQGRQRVRNDQTRRGQFAQRPLGDDCQRPGLDRRGGKFVAVDPLALQTEKEVARFDGAAVGGHPRGNGFASRAKFPSGVHDLAYHAQTQIHARNSLMTAWSLKGSFSSPIC